MLWPRIADAHLTAVSLARNNHAYFAARIVGIRGDSPDDLPGPASQAQLRSWQLDWEESLVRQLIMKRIDENTRSYMSDPDYLALNRTLELIKEERQITEQRAELEARIAADANSSHSSPPAKSGAAAAAT
jgi:hypothetical protein